jgi:putative inorganic carbon (HCO3(-)) transporter
VRVVRAVETAGNSGEQDGFPFVLWALWLYLLVAIGRLAELAPGMEKVPLAKIAMACCVLGLIAGKDLQFRRKLDAPTLAMARTALMLLGVAAFSILISVWKSESANYFLTSALVVAFGFYVTIKLCGDRRRLIATMYVLVLIAFTQAVAAMKGGSGRISAGESYDPNDLAYLLVSVLPMSLAFVSRSSGTRRALNMVLAGLLVAGILLTQSRGGFMALIASTLYLVFVPLTFAATGQSVKRSSRLKRVAAVLFVSALTWVALPTSTRERLATIVSLGSDYNTDTTLTTGRMAIWERNAKATLYRPIGFGIGAFGVVDMQTGGRYKAAHNSVLEVFVELGFLGCFLYLRLYWLAWRALSHPLQNDAEAELFCRALKASLLGNFVSGFFLSQAYSSMVWTLFAVSALAASVLAVSSPGAVGGVMPKGKR